MKVRIKFSKILFMYLIAVLCISVAFYLSFFNLFMKEAWDYRQILLIAFVILSAVAFLIYTYFSNYYEVFKKYCIQHKGRKEYIFYYSEIVYIDEEQSLKKKVISFYTNKGHKIYLPFDKDGKLYKAMLEGAKNAISKEDFIKNYPSIKL